MIDFFRLLACALTRLFRSRARLEAEILVLRHQLNVLRRRSPKRVAFSSIDRLVFAGLYRLAPGVLDALQILKPETVADPSRAPSPSSPETAPWLHPASRPLARLLALFSVFGCVILRHGFASASERVVANGDRSMARVT